MDLGLEAAYDVLACPDSVAVDRIAARETVISHFQAQQMLDMGQVCPDQPSEEYRGNTFYPAAAEIASALCWTTGATLGKIELARELLLGLPEVFEALDCGRIDLMKARAIVERTRELDESVRTELARRAVESAIWHTSRQLRARLARN